MTTAPPSARRRAPASGASATLIRELCLGMFAACATNEGKGTATYLVIEGHTDNTGKRNTT